MSQSIIPGEGLSDLKLNDSLYNVLNKFKDERINIVYSSKDYLNTPIKVEIKAQGINLLFQDDKLKLIELTKLCNEDSMEYYYGNINLNSLITGLNLKVIYNKIFGPTYPGKFVNFDNHPKYLLNYPGISFKFNLGDSKISGLDSGPSLAALLDLKEDILCEEIFIFQESMFEEVLKLVKNDSNVASTVTSSSVPTPSSSDIKDNSTNFKIKANIQLGVILMVLNNKELTVKIGKTTEQEVLNFLGPPDDNFNKFDSRLLIHNNLFRKINKSNDTNKIYKFHNYFKFGVDFLYDLNNNGILSKVLLYNGNLIESFNFNHWNKCNYEIYLGQGSNETSPFDPYDRKINSNFYFTQIPDDFFPGDKTPILLNRGESELMNLEVIPIEEFDRWSQSKLYCFDHCIWEVLNNDCVACVTIY